MRRIEFYKSLSYMNEKECIEKFLIFNASLVISGIKPSGTVTLKKGNNGFYDKWIKYGIEFLNLIEINYAVLRESDDALIILVYNKEVLKKYIFKENNRNFLIKLEYTEEEDLNCYIEKLKARYREFNCPHELGVFLGYPLDDVKDFMESTEKKCLSCRYWRVYNNIKIAEDIFYMYDIIKEHTLNKILSGDTTYNIAFNIRNFYSNYKFTT